MAVKLHKAWSNIEEVTYCKKLPILTQIERFRTVTPIWIHQWYEMMHKAWSSIEEVPYCFARSSVKFQGRTALKIVEFDPDWAFRDCSSSLNSPMGTKWCTKLGSSIKEMPYCSSRVISVKFQGHTALKIVDLTRIVRFRTVAPIWIHQWLCTNEEFRSGALLFARSSVKFQGIVRFRTVAPVWIHQWLRKCR